MPSGLSHDPDDAVYGNASVAGEFGREVKTKFRVPVMTGALGSTQIAQKYWSSFATGAALAGFPIVVGENVVGVDRKSVMENGRIVAAPEMEKRIAEYNRYYDGYGGIIVQVNVEDSRLGVPQYLMDRYGDDVILELKWGQGAKDIGGEIQVKSLAYAQFLKDRGYYLDPDPSLPEVEEAFNRGTITAFARHSRLGATDMETAEAVREDFMATVARYREMGFKRITLKTGAYGMLGLALAIRLAADAKLDLLTIDGAGGGTGMSPWNMMDHWGVPSLPLHAKAWEYCRVLEENGITPPDLSFAGGFAREDHIFKAIALGAPYTKLVCMGRAMMIPGFLGSNIEGVFKPKHQAELNGHWKELPAAVAGLGRRPEVIFAGWEAVQAKVGEQQMKFIPYGAVALVGYIDKLTAGLQQLMAGARKFDLSELSRDDLMAGNRETAHETGLPYVTEAYDEQARLVLKA
jgi:hypothetical protein